MTSSTFAPGSFLPATGTAPGQPLWGEAPRRQPIAPLILMAIVLLLVAAPTAMGGDGSSSNPLALMRGIAESTYDLTGLIAQSNSTLEKIDGNSRNLVAMQEDMTGIAGATEGMATKTTELTETLGGVGDAVRSSREQLGGVDQKLQTTSAGMTAKRTTIVGSLHSTQAIVAEFTKIDGAITSMDSNLERAIVLMSKSAPLTKEFAANRTRKAITGGNTEKFGIPNLAPDNLVMTVVLPMLAKLQAGGALPARKDSHQASNPVIGFALKQQVPDGTNVAAIIKPYDGTYGMPPQAFFVDNRIHGF